MAKLADDKPFFISAVAVKDSIERWIKNRGLAFLPVDGLFHEAASTLKHDAQLKFVWCPSCGIPILDSFNKRHPKGVTHHTCQACSMEVRNSP